MMHDPIPLASIPPGALTVAGIDATMQFAEAEKSEATRAAYDSDWKQFASWCAFRGAVSLPAHSGIVGAYLSHRRPAASGARPEGPAAWDGRLPPSVTATSSPTWSRRPTSRR